MVLCFEAIAGFVRFLKGYYLYAVKEFEIVGKVGSHAVYGVKKAEIFPLFESQEVGYTSSGTWSRLVNPQSPRSLAEDRYKGLFQLVDLSKCFYWSDTYNLAFSLQTNVAARWRSSPTPDHQIHTWNKFLGEELTDTLGYSSLWECPWAINLIHGSFQQQRCTFLGRGVTITLIARRSRCFAGTRYLKRGVSDTGKVANEVEVEQLLQGESILSDLDIPSITSYVQLRGSIPTFWTQETSAAVPKPPIDSFRFDPSFEATRKTL